MMVFYLALLQTASWSQAGQRIFFPDRQALALADDLGMRPLQAHCHLGLGTLYAATGQPAPACAELSAAIALYRRALGDPPAMQYNISVVWVMLVDYGERAMTLAELLPAIRQLPALEKLRLIRILAEDLDTDEDIAPFEPRKMYYVPTPYNTFGAGRALMQAMPQTEIS